jgi:hypothetical protein
VCPPRVPFAGANSQQSLATELEIAKALYFMRSKQFDKAIETLKSYEKKDQTLVAHGEANQQRGGRTRPAPPAPLAPCQPSIPLLHLHVSKRLLPPPL